MSYIIGKNTLEEVLKYKPNILKKIFVTFEEKPKIRKSKILSLIEKNNIEIKYVSKDFLYSLVKTNSHQSFVAEISSRNNIFDIKSFLNHQKRDEKKDKNLFLVMLDNIMDPHNFGAILRSSEAFGIDGVIYSKNRGCDITPVVTKVASGATELIPLIKVSNLASTLDVLKNNDFEILGAENSDEAISLYDATTSNNKVLILGSEESGIQNILRKKIDAFLKIPLLGKINSLNVSAAAAALFCFLQNKNK